MRMWTGRAAKASPASCWCAILLKSGVLGWEVGMVRRCAGECMRAKRVSSLPRKAFFRERAQKSSENKETSQFSLPSRHQKRSRTRDGAVNLRRVTKRRDERRVATLNASVEWEAVPAGAAWVN